MLVHDKEQIERVAELQTKKMALERLVKYVIKILEKNNNKNMH
jgi:hypothetical protein